MPFSTEVHPFALPMMQVSTKVQPDHTDDIDVLDCDDVGQETNTSWADNEEAEREWAEMQGRKYAYIPVAHPNRIRRSTYCSA